MKFRELVKVWKDEGLEIERVIICVEGIAIDETKCPSSVLILSIYGERQVLAEQRRTSYREALNGRAKIRVALKKEG